ncbi:hypothetical protein FRC10_006590, partial [Ceratobasidium sp. 414]
QAVAARGLAGRFNGLPVFNHEDPYVPFTKEFLSALHHADTQLSGLKDLADLITKYELCRPSHGTHGYWDNPGRPNRMTFMLVELLSEQDTQASIYTAIDEPFYRMEHALHSSHGPANFREELSKQPFLDPQTGAMFGGPDGVRHGLFLIFRAVCTLYPPPGSDHELPADSIIPAAGLQYLARTLADFHQQVDRSYTMLSETAPDRRLSEVQKTAYRSLGDAELARQAPAIEPLPRADVAPRAPVFGRTLAPQQSTSGTSSRDTSASRDSAIVHGAVPTKRSADSLSKRANTADEQTSQMPSKPGDVPEEESLPSRTPRAKRIRTSSKPEVLTVSSSEQEGTIPVAATRPRPKLKAVVPLVEAPPPRRNSSPEHIQIPSFDEDPDVIAEERALQPATPPKKRGKQSAKTKQAVKEPTAVSTRCAKSAASVAAESPDEEP